MPRYLLEKAESAAHARQLLKKAPYYATFIPCHYIVCDPTGDSFVFEVDDEDKKHIVDGMGAPQVVANHLFAKHKADNLPKGDTYDRYRTLVAEIGKRGKRPESTR